MPIYLPIYKHVFTVTVLSEVEEYEPDLFNIAAAIIDGDDIGQCEHTSVERIDNAKVLEQELLSIGNNGSFFGSDDDDYEEAV